jgi:ribosomal-protein-alanine N-acetyltransferase
MELETERLVLRPWRDEDLPWIQEINADPRVMEHFVTVLTPAETTAMIRRIQTHFATHGFGFWAVQQRDRDAVIGLVGLAVPTFSAHFMPCVEIGWRIAHQHWGQGYATEAARAALDYGFEQRQLDEIVSFTAVPNVKSQRVMQKLGMHHDPSDDFDHPSVPDGHRLKRHVLYRITRGDWRRVASV